MSDYGLTDTMPSPNSVSRESRTRRGETMKRFIAVSFLLWPPSAQCRSRDAHLCAHQLTSCRCKLTFQTYCAGCRDTGQGDSLQFFQPRSASEGSQRSDIPKEQVERRSRGYDPSRRAGVGPRADASVGTTLNVGEPMPCALHPPLKRLRPGR
jgi:hypothetical protein